MRTQSLPCSPRSLASCPLPWRWACFSSGHPGCYGWRSSCSSSAPWPRCGSRRRADAVLTKPAATTPDGRSILGPPLADTGRPPQGAGRPLYERPPTANRERQARINVARERQRLGLPLYVPEVVLSLAAMSVIRGSVGFLTFFLAFALRHLHAATWWFGFVLLTSAIGSLFGSLLVPVLRRYLSEQQLILYSLVLSGLVGIIAAVLGSLWAQPLLTLAIGFATTAAKPSFDSIAQRHVPPALLGRAFARFETQLQLVWVLCALLAVAVGFSLAGGRRPDRRDLCRRCRVPRLDAPRRDPEQSRSAPDRPGRPSGHLAELSYIRP